MKIEICSNKTTEFIRVMKLHFIRNLEITWKKIIHFRMNYVHSKNELYLLSNCDESKMNNEIYSLK